MSGIRVIVYGVGSLNRIAVRLLVEKGADIVGAVNRAGPKIGRDVGELAGLGRTLGVPVTDDVEGLLARTEADVALVGVYDDMERMEPIYARLLEAGINVVTLGAHASFPRRIAPEIAARLDALAKRHGVTLTGSGNQDLFMVNAGVLATGVCHRLDALIHRSLSDVNRFGPEVARIAGVGLTPEAFEERRARGGEPPSVYTTFWDNVAADLGLTVTSVRQTSEPVIAERALEGPGLGRPVEPGRLAGIVQRLELETEEGVRLAGEYALRMALPGERDFKAWIVRGEPDLELRFERLEIGFTTASQAVNRIPDVINAEPGYVTLERLPKLKCRIKPLAAYVAGNRG